MLVLIIGLLLFFGIHSISIVVPDRRDALAARLGRGPWRALHGLLSLAGLALIVWGFGLARQEPVLLYLPPNWLRHLGILLLVPVFPLMFAAFFPGRIRERLRYPVLVAVKVWALAHLLMNGMLAELLLFGSFLAWAVAGRISLKRRPPLEAPMAPATRWNDAIAVALGLAVYVAFIAGLHQWLIGRAVI